MSPALIADIAACAVAVSVAFVVLRLRHRQTLAVRSWGYIAFACLLQGSVALAARHTAGAALGDATAAQIGAAGVGMAVGSVSFFALTAPTLRPREDGKRRLALGSNKLAELFDGVVRDLSRAQDVTKRDKTVGKLLRSASPNHTGGHPLFANYLRYLGSGDPELSTWVRKTATSARPLPERLDAVLGAMEDRKHYDFRRQQLAYFRWPWNRRNGSAAAGLPEIAPALQFDEHPALPPSPAPESSSGTSAVPTKGTGPTRRRRKTSATASGDSTVGADITGGPKPSEGRRSPRRRPATDPPAEG